MSPSASVASLCWDDVCRLLSQPKEFAWLGICTTLADDQPMLVLAPWSTGRKMHTSVPHKWIWYWLLTSCSGFAEKYDELPTSSYRPCDCNMHKALQLIQPAGAYVHDKRKLCNTMMQTVSIGFLSCKQLHAEPLPSSHACGYSTSRMLGEVRDIAALCLHVSYCLACVACIAS